MRPIALSLIPVSIHSSAALCPSLYVLSVTDAHLSKEFAMDIGNNLLAEIRRLQSLLTERDKAIQDMKEERDDLERTIEALKTTLKEQERSSGNTIILF
jgi:hypothetical protein